MGPVTEGLSVIVLETLLELQGVSPVESTLNVYSLSAAGHSHIDIPSHFYRSDGR